MPVRPALWAAVLLLCLAPALSAQDATKVDPKHYKVVSENDLVRIVKVHYGAHEKSVMHSHPNLVAVYLTDGKLHFSFPDGKTQDATGKAHEAQYTPAVTHLPENAGDKPFEAILVELKGRAAGEKGEKGAAKPAKAEKK